MAFIDREMIFRQNQEVDLEFVAAFELGIHFLFSLINLFILYVFLLAHLAHVLKTKI